MEGLQLFARANSGAMRLAPDDARTQKAARPDFSDDFGMMEFAAPIEQHAPSTAPSQATAGPSQDMDLSMFLQNLSLQKFEGGKLQFHIYITCVKLVLSGLPFTPSHLPTQF
jgi:hypothetical protein